MEKSVKSAKTQSKKSKKSSKSSPGNHKLVEYSDVSSNELSAPEAGELPSDGLSIVSDDEISTIGASTNKNNNNNNSIYEPIDDDDEELMEKLMDDDVFSDSFSESSKRKSKKQKKKRKKLKKSKKRKKQRHSSEESVEEISDDEALLDNAGDKSNKRMDEGGTPPLDQISFTPKSKFNSYTPISPGTSPILNASPESLSDAPPGTTSASSKRNNYRSPHTPPLPKKITEELSRSIAVIGGRHSSMSSSASQKASSKKRHATPERSNSYRKRAHSRDTSPYEYESRRYRDRERERERVSSPYGSGRKYRDRRRRSRYEILKMLLSLLFISSDFRSVSTPPRKRSHRTRSPPRYRSPSPLSRRSPSKSPSPSLLAKVVPKKSININDTSLFAELVKRKHEREKVLKEILSSSDCKDDSKVINVDALDGNDSKESNGDLKDIPIPPSSNGVLYSSSAHLDTTDHAIPPPPPPESQYVIKKSKAMDLPMPPGVIVPSDVRTPSPTKESAGPSKKIKLLDMPMPPMIPGTEDLSNDENDAMFGRKKIAVRGNGTAAKTTRPKILQRRRSDNSVGDWGERCVEVFQIMAQIGEGKHCKTHSYRRYFNPLFRDIWTSLQSLRPQHERSCCA